MGFEILNPAKKKLNNRLVTDTLIVFLGNAFAQGLNFLIVVILARTLGPNEISLYTVSISLLTLLLAIADSGISNSIVNLANREKAVQDIYLKIGLIFRGSLGIIIYILGFIIVDYLAIDVYQNPRLSNLFFYTFGGVVVLTVHGYIATLYQVRGNFVKRSKFLVLTALIRFIFIAFLVYLLPEKNLSLETIVLAYVGAPLLIIILYIKDISYISRIKIERTKFINTSKKLFNYAKWLFLSMLAVILIMRIDQFMLLKLGTVQETSYYAIAVQLSMILPMLTESLTTVLLPKISESRTDLVKYRLSIIKKLTPVCLVIMLLTIPAKYLITSIFGVDYEPSIPIFQMMMLGFVIGIMLNPLSLIFYATSKVKYLTVLNYIQLILIVCLNLILIPDFGGMGAAVGAVFVRVVALIYVLIFSNRILKVSIK